MSTMKDVASAASIATINRFRRLSEGRAVSEGRAISDNDLMNSPDGDVLVWVNHCLRDKERRVEFIDQVKAAHVGRLLDKLLQRLDGVVAGENAWTCTCKEKNGVTQQACARCKASREDAPLPMMPRRSAALYTDASLWARLDTVSRKHGAVIAVPRPELLAQEADLSSALRGDTVKLAAVLRYIKDCTQALEAKFGPEPEVAFSWPIKRPEMLRGGNPLTVQPTGNSTESINPLFSPTHSASSNSPRSSPRVGVVGDRNFSVTAPVALTNGIGAGGGLSWTSPPGIRSSLTRPTSASPSPSTTADFSHLTEDVMKRPPSPSSLKGFLSGGGAAPWWPKGPVKAGEGSSDVSVSAVVGGGAPQSPTAAQAASMKAASATRKQNGKNTNTSPIVSPVTGVAGGSGHGTPPTTNRKEVEDGDLPATSTSDPTECDGDPPVANITSQRRSSGGIKDLKDLKERWEIAKEVVSKSPPLGANSATGVAQSAHNRAGRGSWDSRDDTGGGGRGNMGAKIKSFLGSNVRPGGQPQPQEQQSLSSSSSPQRNIYIHPAEDKPPSSHHMRVLSDAGPKGSRPVKGSRGAWESSGTNVPVVALPSSFSPTRSYPSPGHRSIASASDVLMFSPSTSPVPAVVVVPSSPVLSPTLNKNNADVVMTPSNRVDVPPASISTSTNSPVDTHAAAVVASAARVDTPAVTSTSLIAPETDHPAPGVEEAAQNPLQRRIALSVTVPAAGLAPVPKPSPLVTSPVTVVTNFGNSCGLTSPDDAPDLPKFYQKRLSLSLAAPLLEEDGLLPTHATGRLGRESSAEFSPRSKPTTPSSTKHHRRATTRGGSKTGGSGGSNNSGSASGSGSFGSDSYRGLPSTASWRVSGGLLGATPKAATSASAAAADKEKEKLSRTFSGVSSSGDVTAGDNDSDDDDLPAYYQAKFGVGTGGTGGGDAPSKTISVNTHLSQSLTAPEKRSSLSSPERRSSVGERNAHVSHHVAFASKDDVSAHPQPEEIPETPPPQLASPIATTARKSSTESQRSIASATLTAATNAATSIANATRRKSVGAATSPITSPLPLSPSHPHHASVAVPSPPPLPPSSVKPPSSIAAFVSGVGSGPSTPPKLVRQGLAGVAAGSRSSLPRSSDTATPPRAAHKTLADSGTNKPAVSATGSPWSTRSFLVRSPIPSPPGPSGLGGATDSTFSGGTGTPAPSEQPPLSPMGPLRAVKSSFEMVVSSFNSLNVFGAGGGANNTGIDRESGTATPPGPGSRSASPMRSPSPLLASSSNSAVPPGRRQSRVRIPHPSDEALLIVTKGKTRRRPLLVSALGLLCSASEVGAALLVCRGWRLALATETMGLLQRAARMRGIPDLMRPHLYRFFLMKAGPPPQVRRLPGAVTKGGDSGTAAFAAMVREGEKTKAAAMIARDVPRAFGKIAPHKRPGSSRHPATPGGGEISLFGTQLFSRLSISSDMFTPLLDEEASAEQAWALVPLDTKRKCLSNVLLAAVGHHKDVGYCQGQDRLVEHVMRVYCREPFDESAQNLNNSLNMSTSNHTNGAAIGRRVFEVYAGIFEAYRLRELYEPERGGMLICVEVLAELVKRRLPNLSAHFTALDFTLDMVAFNWFQTLFCGANLPRPSLLRVWDWWISSGDLEVFIRVPLAIFQLVERQLIDKDFEGVAGYLAALPDPHLLSPSRLLKAAMEFELAEGELMHMEQKVRERERFPVPSVAALLLRPNGISLMGAEVSSP